MTKDYLGFWIAGFLCGFGTGYLLALRVNGL